MIIYWNVNEIERSIYSFRLFKESQDMFLKSQSLIVEVNRTLLIILHQRKYLAVFVPAFSPFQLKSC
uniref:Uncharacterized protein n=1 Tax=Octopus bimaculoides TaxID=37653 RepID=A0A0L8IAK4_OCTBM